MKHIPINENDGLLFNSPFYKELFFLYSFHLDETRTMVVDQGVGFWIQFVTSFRSFAINNRGTRDIPVAVSEDAFIDMLEMITKQDRLQEFRNLVRSLNLLNMALMQNDLLVMLNPWIRYMSTGFMKPLDTMQLYFRFFTSFMTMFLRWKSSPSMLYCNTSVKWIPPAHWENKQVFEQYGQTQFEDYLKKRWGSALYKILHLEISQISWLEMEDITHDRRKKRRRRKRRRMFHHSKENSEPSPLQNNIKKTSCGNLNRNCVGSGLPDHCGESQNHARSNQVLYRKCDNCNNMEEKPGIYKRCTRCLKEEMDRPKVYCSKHCQSVDWEKNHKSEHQKKHFHLFPNVNKSNHPNIKNRENVTFEMSNNKSYETVNDDDDVRGSNGLESPEKIALNSSSTCIKNETSRSAPSSTQYCDKTKSGEDCFTKQSKCNGVSDVKEGVVWKKDQTSEHRKKHFQLFPNVNKSNHPNIKNRENVTFKMSNNKSYETVNDDDVRGSNGLESPKKIGLNSSSTCIKNERSRSAPSSTQYCDKTKPGEDCFTKQSKCNGVSDVKEGVVWKKDQTSEHRKKHFQLFPNVNKNNHPNIKNRENDTFEMSNNKSYETVNDNDVRGSNGLESPKKIGLNSSSTCIKNETSRSALSSTQYCDKTKPGEDCFTKQSKCNGVSDVKEVIRKCDYCGEEEKSVGSFKRCSLCIEEEVQKPKLYCSKNCQRLDWEGFHKKDHRRKRFQLFSTIETNRKLNTVFKESEIINETKNECKKEAISRENLITPSDKATINGISCENGHATSNDIAAQRTIKDNAVVSSTKKSYEEVKNDNGKEMLESESSHLTGKSRNINYGTHEQSESERKGTNISESNQKDSEEFTVLENPKKNHEHDQCNVGACQFTKQNSESVTQSKSNDFDAKKLSRRELRKQKKKARRKSHKRKQRTASAATSKEDSIRTSFDIPAPPPHHRQTRHSSAATSKEDSIRTSFGIPAPPPHHRQTRHLLYRKCDYCHIFEDAPGVYKYCGRCIEEKKSVPKVYCCKHCQILHWKTSHKAEHQRKKFCN